MEKIGNLVSTNQLRTSMQSYSEPVPAQMSQSDMGPFREVMARLSSEYNWDLTQEDSKTWSELAIRIGVNRFCRSVAAYLKDNTVNSDGSLTCQWRPKAGQIMALAAKISQSDRWQEQTDKNLENAQIERASNEFVAEQMAEVREQAWFKRHAHRREALKRNG
tara:strand:- start:127 stop:615 length:489 start_codon:yes stop_codon:yes gene_type:complete